jgi:esterase/lipase superfamily enzyme
MAHSMGTWLAVESLRQMAIREGKLPSKIHNVILASPDLDVNVFARQWTEMGSSHPKFTIFVSQDDRALAASSLISGGVTRVGAINPGQEPYRSALQRAGITVIDLTKLKTGDSLNHGKFAESPAIVQLIGQRLVTGQTLTASDVSLGEGVGAVLLGTVNTANNVVATVVTAPVKAFQPRAVPVQPTPINDIFSSDPNVQP